MNKKAISGVVVAILLLLIAVIAVSIFWFALRTTIEESAEGVGKGKECITLSLKIESANSVTNKVKVKREVGVAPLDKVKILVNGAEALLVDAITGEDEIKELETNEYTIPITPTDLLAANDKVEVAGILEGEITCPVSDTATAA